MKFYKYVPLSTFNLFYNRKIVRLSNREEDIIKSNINGKIVLFKEEKYQIGVPESGGIRLNVVDYIMQVNCEWVNLFIRFCKSDDEWFSLFYYISDIHRPPSPKDLKHYICDQLDGLVQLISDIIDENNS